MDNWLARHPIVKNYYCTLYQFADPECLSRIRIFSIPDPGSLIRIKEFKYFKPKNGFYALGNMIRVVPPGSGSRS